MYTKILEVNLFAFAYRLFPRDFSPINGAYLCVYIIVWITHWVYWSLRRGRILLILWRCIQAVCIVRVTCAFIVVKHSADAPHLLTDVSIKSIKRQLLWRHLVAGGLPAGKMHPCNVTWLNCGRVGHLPNCPSLYRLQNTQGEPEKCSKPRFQADSQRSLLLTKVTQATIPVLLSNGGLCFI